MDIACCSQSYRLVGSQRLYSGTKINPVKKGEESRSPLGLGTGKRGSTTATLKQGGVDLLSRLDPWNPSQNPSLVKASF